MVYIDKFKYDKYVLENYLSLNDEEVELNNIHWNFLSCQWRMKLPDSFIVRFRDYLNFYELSKRGNLSDYILNTLEGHWNWHIIIRMVKNITPFILRKYRSLNLYFPGGGLSNISRRIKLEDIDSYSDIISWEIISKRKDLSKKFIAKNMDKLNVDTLLKCSNIHKVCDSSYINKLKIALEMLR